MIKKTSSLQRIFLSKGPLGRYNTELRLKCAARGFDITSPTAAKQIGRIIKVWLEKNSPST